MQGCSQGGRGGLLKPPFWSTEDFVHHLQLYSGLFITLVTIDTQVMMMMIYTIVCNVTKTIRAVHHNANGRQSDSPQDQKPLKNTLDWLEYSNRIHKQPQTRHPPNQTRCIPKQSHEVFKHLVGVLGTEATYTSNSYQEAPQTVFKTYTSLLCQDPKSLFTHHVLQPMSCLQYQYPHFYTVVTIQAPNHQ